METPYLPRTSASWRFDGSTSACAASALNHPGMAAVYDVGREGSLAYIAMELIEGQRSGP